MNKVSDVYKMITLEPHLIRENSTLNDILATFKEINPIHRSLYVVDSKKRLIGIITLQEIFNIYSIKQGMANTGHFSKMVLLDYLEKETTAHTIMRRNVFVNEDMTLKQAIQLMIKENLHELPVVDKNRFVIGDLNVHEILRTINVNNGSI